MRAAHEPGEVASERMARKIEMLTVILAAAGPDLDNALGKLPAAIRQAAADEVAAVGAGLLDINPIDVPAAGWRARRDLVAAARKDTEVITRQANLELSGIFSLRKGLRLLPATDYLVSEEQTKASGDARESQQPTRYGRQRGAECSSRDRKRPGTASRGRQREMTTDRTGPHLFRAQVSGGSIRHCSNFSRTACNRGLRALYHDSDWPHRRHPRPNDYDMTSRSTAVPLRFLPAARDGGSDAAVAASRALPFRKCRRGDPRASLFPGATGVILLKVRCCT
jgi:hypothetical protein